MRSWAAISGLLSLTLGLTLANATLGTETAHAFWPEYWSDFWFASSEPEVVPLTTVTSERNSVTHTFSALVNDQDELVGMRVDDDEPGSKPGIYDLSVVRKGFSTLDSGACEIWAPNIDARFGGEINLVLLYNGISDSKRLFTIRLNKTPTNDWELTFENRGYSQKFDHLHFTLRKKAFITVGIKSVQIRLGKQKLGTVELEDLPNIER